MPNIISTELAEGTGAVITAKKDFLMARRLRLYNKLNIEVLNILKEH